mmetsp:Transcript_9762/g.14514  ORF Transcript_9762/g.14514 Transcript_9762/m.14514 type:complete len:803 (+) Transcript_9762:353-2761(+)
MRPSRSALSFLLLSLPQSDAFSPSPITTQISLTPSASASASISAAFGIRIRQTHQNSSSSSSLFASSSLYDDDDEDSDDEDDDDYPTLTTTARSTPLPKLDPYDPNPPIKPRPGRFGFQSLEAEADAEINDYDLVQTMSDAERAENLKIMRQIKKSDLADLRLRKDHAGWVDANNDLKARTKADPWYRVNDKIKDAYLLGNEDKVEELKVLAEKLGGPPPGVKVGDRGYALHTEIYDIGISAGRAASALEQSILEERVRRGRAMAAERRKNLEKEQKDWEDMMRNPGEREDKEAKDRRERTMGRLRAEIEEDNKKREERAKEMLGQLPELPKDSASSLEKALEEARADVKRLRKMRREGRGLGEVSEDADLTFMNPEDRLAAEDAGKTQSSKPKGSAARAREAAAAEAAGGRPRLPGDPDVTRGEIKIPIESSSSTTSGPLTVEVSSKYNTEQSDPPMRKHCFQYTIRITNNSPSDTIQLLSRRFEIQTVGSSMKDVVQGEGVTGRTPILKPGEVFEYTSTAPLSVRPIATTIIAARMKGEYNFVTLKSGQETATPEQIKTGGDDSAELGMFHFVFPEEQRVKPIQSTEEEEDDDDDDNNTTSTSTATVSSSTSAKPKSVSPPASSTSPSSAPPASTLPGDSDMSSGNVATSSVSDSSNIVTDNVRVQVSSTYRPERSDTNLNKHCFAYNVRITNESPKQNIQLVSRRFEIQTVGSSTKDVVQGPGVTGRQPILKPGESFEYTSTAPLSVKPILDKTAVVARMEGEYNFVLLGDDGTTPISSTPLQAKMGVFHFILPDLGNV